jgi:WD40 repeat protein
VKQTGVVSKYNATTGEVINENFITGLDAPWGLALSGNILFVTNADSGTVGKYDATTGGAINAGFITGLDEPLPVAVSGNSLFVSYTSGYGSAVGEYDATTGAVINTNFITGPNVIFGLTVLGDKLFVTSLEKVRKGVNIYNIGAYDATTGAAINASLITGPSFLYAAKGNTLFLGDSGGHLVGKYDAATGKAIDRRFITRLPGVDDIALLDNNIFVLTGYERFKVGKYDATGTAINPRLVTGLNVPSAIAVKAAK